jgi:hypothetical protein
MKTFYYDISPVPEYLFLIKKNWSNYKDNVHKIPEKQGMIATVRTEIITTKSILSKMLQTIFTALRNVGKKAHVIVEFRRANWCSEKKNVLPEVTPFLVANIYRRLEELHSISRVKNSERRNIPKKPEAPSKNCTVGRNYVSQLVVCLTLVTLMLHG